MVEPLSHRLCMLIWAQWQTSALTHTDLNVVVFCCFLFPYTASIRGSVILVVMIIARITPQRLEWQTNLTQYQSRESHVYIWLWHIPTLLIYLLEWLIICIMQNYYGISMDTAKLKLCILRNSLQSFVSFASFVAELQVLVVALDRLLELQRPCGGCGSSQLQEVKDSGLYWKSQYATRAP